MMTLLRVMLTPRILEIGIRYLVNRRLVTYDAHHFVGSVCLVSGELITLGDLGYQSYDVNHFVVKLPSGLVLGEL